jgi:hypothetical protein
VSEVGADDLRSLRQLEEELQPIEETLAEVDVRLADIEKLIAEMKDTGSWGTRCGTSRRTRRRASPGSETASTGCGRASPSGGNRSGRSARTPPTPRTVSRRRRAAP